jgi:serine/threonine protein phosphatase PrpC
MEAYLDYPSESDQLVYRRGSIQSSQYIIEITAATIAGSVIKANEDAFAVVSSGETLIAAVFDGTTSLKPIKALGSQSGARFASHHLKDYINTLNVDDAPEDILLTMNHSLLAASTALGGTLADTHSLPSSLATLLEFTLGTDQVNFSHVGDSFGILFYTDGRSVVFTPNGTTFATNIQMMRPVYLSNAALSIRRAKTQDAYRVILVFTNTL